MAFNIEMLRYFANKMWRKNKDTFVSKETGKSLSTNDYTNEDKNKLDNLSAETTTYDNTTSGLTSTNVQGAIDELKSENGFSLTSTLTAGQTSLTFTDAGITENSILSAVYTSIFGVSVSSANIVTGSLTLTFPQQEEDVTIKVVIN